MSQVFFIADPHFGHKNIIQYENRPFPDVETMDAALIERWNQTVSPEDIVYLAGDFSFYGREKTKAIAAKLQGRKRLVMGNHDNESVSFYYGAGFERVYDCPIVFQEFWLVSHEPLYLNSNMPYGNLFGHVHGNPAYADYSPQSFCISAERIGYRPISFEEIKRRMFAPAQADAEQAAPRPE